MSYGLEVWDGSGNKNISITDSISRILTVIGPISSNGSQVVSGLNTGRPYTFTKLTAEPYRVAVEVTVNQSNQTVSWVFKKIQLWDVDAFAYIVVGVY